MCNLPLFGTVKISPSWHDCISRHREHRACLQLQPRDASHFRSHPSKQASSESHLKKPYMKPTYSQTRPNTPSLSQEGRECAVDTGEIFLTRACGCTLADSPSGQGWPTSAGLRSGPPRHQWRGSYMNPDTCRENWIWDEGGVEKLNTEDFVVKLTTRGSSHLPPGGGVPGAPAFT